MPPKKRRKRRPKQRIQVPWHPVFWGLFGVSVVVGLGFSPLTRVSSVRVVGCPAFLRPVAEDTVKGLRSIPFAALDQSGVATRLRAESDVRTAQFTANVFGRGVLRVELRKPVARVVLSGRIALDEEGDIFATKQEVKGLPLVSIPPETSRPGAALASPVEGRAIVDLLTHLRRLLPQEACSLAVDARGVISLTLERGGVVEFGSTEDLDEKVKVLGQVLQSEPGLLDQVRKLNLTSPDQPVVVRG